ncbi:sucrase ferredoxin [Cryptosporangium minutisporangium]|uniref:Sucrase ferredoxin n=1 Tax=Cryptosporangium minutisporangium TaxID=113569 RepID=A0ABP6T7A4_9ACTN
MVTLPAAARAEPKPRCSVTARARGDQLFATAAPGERWLLIEHGGPWPRRAFEASPELLRIAERATSAGFRAVLIRRPGRARPAADRAYALVDARPGREGVWWGTFTDERELLDVPLEPTGVASPEPVQLVCAHGRHDTCCAVEGRPVAAALDAARPGSTWECSHVGGDRFSANLVLLPHGLYYGTLDPGTALAVAEAYRAGRLVPQYLRGRSAFPPAVQAAQHYARLATGDDRIDALRPLGAQTLDDGTVRVRLDGATITVRAGWSAPAMLTCAADRPQPARIFEQVALSTPGR